MRDEFKKWVSVPTRFRDLDPMNHVNSTIYFVYFEMARIEYFKDIGIAQMRDTGKSGIPVVSQTCNYRQQIFHPSTLDIGVRCAELGESTVHLAYEIYLHDTDTLVADGVTISTCVDLTVPKAIPLPGELRQAFQDFEGIGPTIGP
ncbi:MAG: thioesterase family protein [Candidatus Hydrogenedentes bacterium]|nr:thioesterase family protein [Candidatus Hydrogenedentota bacterium]